MKSAAGPFGVLHFLRDGSGNPAVSDQESGGEGELYLTDVTEIFTLCLFCRKIVMSYLMPSWGMG